mmetsp:Transcript_32235/g.75678  ORF Transcript_32235/g.75678 Transcript_32235/m.75678 type:complete len:241 (+) Transcript_32235:384-1106(+)
MLNNEQGQLKRAKHGLIPVYGTDSSDCRGSKNWDWEINVWVKLVSHPALVLLCVGAALQVPVQLLQRLTKLRLTSFVRLQEHGAEVDLLGQAVTEHGLDKDADCLEVHPGNETLTVPSFAPPHKRHPDPLEVGLELELLILLSGILLRIVRVLPGVESKVSRLDLELIHHPFEEQNTEKTKVLILVHKLAGARHDKLRQSLVVLLPLLVRVLGHHDEKGCQVLRLDNILGALGDDVSKTS